MREACLHQAIELSSAYSAAAPPPAIRPDNHPHYTLTSLHYTSTTMRPATRISGAAFRRAIRTPLRAPSPAHGVMARAAIVRSATALRPFHSSIGLRSIMPDAENPAPKESETTDQPTAPTEITTEEFHERADHYLNELVQRLEEAQENDPAIEVDYSVCALGVCYPYFIVIPVLLTSMACAGRRPRSDSQGAHLRPQQTASQQADLAQLAHIRTQALRLGRYTGGHGLQGGWWCQRLGLPARWQFAHRDPEEGARCRRRH